jgi:hypothetical protein
MNLFYLFLVLKKSYNPIDFNFLARPLRDYYQKIDKVSA